MHELVVLWIYYRNESVSKNDGTQV
jgi:hypothetical protein